MQNKLKLNTVLLVIIIILLVVVLGYFFLRDSRVEKGVSINVPQEEGQKNLSGIDSDQQKVDVINTIKQNEHTYRSNTFSYSIGYSGIDTKNVLIESDGKKINLFPNQSYIDSLEIVDSSYVMPSYISLIGTVTFGTNEYKKFKDNITQRHTYYLKSGLKNGKSMFITVENDSDNPNYLNLASLKIQSLTTACNIGYEKTAESKVVSEQSPTLITGFEKKCDGNYYITFDYLGPGQGSMSDIENGTGSYYTNTNLKLRTFKVDSNLKVKLTNNIEVAFIPYVSSLQKIGFVIFNQDNAYIRKGLAEPGVASPVISITVKNGIVISMIENYLP